MSNNKWDAKILLIKWKAELVDLDRTIHEAIEKSKYRIYELELELAKEETAEPLQIDKGSRTGKPDRD